ncbi:MAG: SprB repeat-containing protein, partial [Flavobacteriales bacterium]|nr:SprB repeat-containing protein [Flavobacteriales bacterium]
TAGDVLDAQSSGSYDVVVTDGNGCSGSNIGVISDVNGPSVLLGLNVDVTCFGLADGIQELNVTDGTVFYDVYVDDDPTSGNPPKFPQVGSELLEIDDLLAGNHSLYIIDDANCSLVAAFTTNEPDSMETYLTPTHPQCFEAQDGSITSATSGGNAGYTYSWTTTSTSTPSGQDPSVLADGTYTISVTDALGCTATNLTDLNEPTDVTAIISAFTPPACDGDNNGNATVSYQGGTPNYDIAWDGGTPITNFAPLDHQNTGMLGDQQYCVTVTDAQSCSETACVTLVDPTILAVTIPTSTNISCNGDCNGTADAAGSGGIGAYSFLWSNAETNASINGLCPGTYTVVMEDDNGCQASTTVLITEPDVLELTQNLLTNPSCFGAEDGAIDLNTVGGTGPFTYAWTGSSSISEDTTNLFDGDYDVTVLDANGCTASITNKLVEPQEILYNIANTVQSTCQQSDGRIDILVTQGGGPYTYLWSDNVTTTDFLDGIPNGSYDVTVTAANTCTTIAAQGVSDAAAPTVSIVSQPDTTSCFGVCDGTALAFVTGGNTPYAFQWFSSSNVADIIPTETALGISTLCAGNDYFFRVTDASGCVDWTDVSVETFPLLESIINLPTDVSCHDSSDGSATVTVWGGNVANDYTYSWVPAAQGIATASDRLFGTHLVVVTDDNGCTTTSNTVINEPAYVIPTALEDIGSLCGDTTGQATATAVGGTNGPYTFEWVTPPWANQISPTATGLSNNQYTVTATDANGCSGTGDVVIGFVPGPAITAQVVSIPSCPGDADGVVSASSPQGLLPFVYQWSNAQTGQYDTLLVSDDYTVTITDGNGCVATAEVFLPNPDPLAAVITVQAQATCNDSCDGTASIAVTGGTLTNPLYGYLFTNNSNQGVSQFGQFSSLCAGSLTVTVSDDKGCTVVANETITEPIAVVVDTTNVDYATCGQPDGQAWVSATGGSGTGFQFTWGTSPQQNGAASPLLAAGSYTVTATDGNSCPGTMDVIIPNLNGPSAVVNIIKGVDCYGGSDGQLEVVATLGQSASPIASYSWDPVPGTASGQGTSTFNNLTAQNYCVTVTDGTGCSIAACNTVPTSPEFIVSLSKTMISCEGGSDGEMLAVPSGGTGSGTYSYEWPTDGNSITQGITGLTFGPHAVTVTDGNLCQQTASLTLSDPIAMSGYVDPTDVLCFGDSTGQALFSSINEGGEGTNYTYQWNNNQLTQSATFLKANTYTVTVTSNQGCIGVFSGVVNQDPQLQVVPGALIQPNCFGDQTGAWSVAVQGGDQIPGGGYYYTWSTGGSTSSAASGIGGSVIPLCVTVTDAGGCQVNVCDTIHNPPYLGLATTGLDPSCHDNNYIGAASTSSCLGDGSVTAIANGGTPPLSYAWSQNSLSQNVPTASNLCADNYTVTVTDANSCTVTGDVEITSPPELQVNAIYNQSTCGNPDGQITAIPYGGANGIFSILWDDNTTGMVKSNLTAGSYNVTISDQNNCVLESVFSFGDILGPVNDTIYADSISCFGANDGVLYTTVPSIGTAPYTYTWNNSVGDSYGGSAAIATTGLPQGLYDLVVVDALGCVAAEGTVGIIEPPQIIFDAFILDIDCFGFCDAEVMGWAVGGVEPYTMMWTNALSTSGIGVSETATQTGLCAGTYTITIEDVNGCQETLTRISSEPTTPLQLTTVGVTPNFCYDETLGTITVSLQGGTIIPGNPDLYAYNWSNNVNNTGFTNSAYNLRAGAYSLTVTDDNSCTVSDVYVITEPTELVLTLTTDSSHCDRSDGGMTANVSGGTPSYSYVWGTGSTEQSIVDVLANTYTVSVTDNNGCTIT